jgi:hypothetical protein
MVLPSTSPLILFCRIWALAECFHLLSFGGWVYHPLGLVRFATLAWFLGTSFSPRRFSLMLGADALYVMALTPFTPNHILFTMFVDVTLLSIFARHAVRAPGRMPLDAVYAQVQSLMRIELLILYAFAVFHKLNRDFFDLGVSCAGGLLLEMRERYPFLPVGSQMVALAVYGTLLTEAAIPLLLCFRSLRRWGIVLGLGFHLFLSAHQHVGLHSFSALMFALLFTCIPAPDVKAAVDRLRRSRGFERLRSVAGEAARKPIGTWARLGGVAFGVGLLVVFLGDIDVRHLEAYLYAGGQTFWIGCALVCIALYLASAFRVKGPEPGVVSFLFPARVPPIVLVMPLLIALHSFSPYLGLKTVPCLSMFSNLRTEGPLWNHLIVPKRVKLFGFQDDLVEVLSSSKERFTKLADEKLLVPYFELSRMVNRVETPLTLAFERNGRTIAFEEALPGERPGIEPTSWLLGKLLRFRPVDAEGPMRCRW